MSKPFASQLTTPKSLCYITFAFEKVRLSQSSSCVCKQFQSFEAFAFAYTFSSSWKQEVNDRESIPSSAKPNDSPYCHVSTSLPLCCTANGNQRKYFQTHSYPIHRLFFNVYEHCACMASDPETRVTNGCGQILALRSSPYSQLLGH